MEVSKRFI